MSTAPFPAPAEGLNDAALAAALAEAAGQMLVALRRDPDVAAADWGSEGDRRANALICAALARHRPGDAILSEEETDDAARLSARRVWIIDPLDGTREYGEGRSDWAVHVALTDHGVPTAGAVALPALGQLFRSDAPARLPPVRLPGDGAGPRLLVSRTRHDARIDVLVHRLGGTLVPVGSAGAKAMAVLRGEAEIYAHAGGMRQWDSCAPVAVAAAHGLTACRIDGSAAVYNDADVNMPDLLICHPAWREAVLAALL